MNHTPKLWLILLFPAAVAILARHFPAPTPDPLPQAAESPAPTGQANPPPPVYPEPVPDPDGHAPPGEAAERGMDLTRIRPAVERHIGRHLEHILAQVANIADLDEEEKSRIADEFEEIATAEIQRWLDHLSQPGSSPVHLFSPERPPVEEHLVMQILANELEPDEFTAFDEARTRQKALEVERNANRQVRRLGHTLGLTEAQKDQVFAILVADSDPRFAAANPAAPTMDGPGISADEEIREILSPEQRAVFDDDLKTRKAARAAWLERWESPGP